MSPAGVEGRLGNAGRGRLSLLIGILIVDPSFFDFLNHAVDELLHARAEFCIPTFFLFGLPRHGRNYSPVF